MSGRTVGIIGGMGPAATVHFMARLQALTGAARDEDHLRLIVDCNPHVPDRNAAAQGGASPQAVLAAMAKGLEAAGAQLLVMPCNAAHAYAGAITAATSIPFLDLIEAAADEVAALEPRCVGVLAADGCREAGLYQSAFAQRGVATILCEPAAQAHFMALIYRIKAGEVGVAARGEMKGLAGGLIDAGAEVILAGCTEIPLVLSPGDVAGPMVDSIEALARRTIAIARS